METISITTRTAKKRHECNACLFLFMDFSDYRLIKMEFPEYREIVKAKNANGIIEKGEVYEEFVGKEDGEIFRVRQKPAIHQICLKYDLYPI